MKLVRCFVLIFSFFLIAISCDKDNGNPVGPDTGVEYGTVEVRVADQFELPYEGVTISLESENGESISETLSDASGIARFDSLPAGTYDISSSTGRMDGDNLVIDYQALDISVSDGETVPVSIKYKKGMLGSEAGSLVIRTVDEHEKAFKGIYIEIQRATWVYKDRKTYTAFSNVEGIARFDSLPPGEYSINVENFSYKTFDIINSEAPGINHQMLGISVLGGDSELKTFYYPTGPVDISFEAVFIDNVDERYDDLELNFPDWGRTITLDDQGHGVLANIILSGQLNSVTGYASRDGKTGGFFSNFKTNSSGWPYLSVSIYSNPVVEILTPHQDSIFYTDSIQLTSLGTDLKDGRLPDENLSWKSDIDGELGTGRDIQATLSIGHHTIYLSGTDSDGNYSGDIVYVIISSYSEDTYFPFPNNGFWKYRYDTPELIVTTDTGTTERWTLDEMAVLVEDITARTCRMDWTVGRGGETMSCRYELTDHLTTDGNRFLVTATDEQFIVTDGDKVVEELTVTTVYTPSYPLLVDYLDPQSGTQEDITVTAESVLAYTVTDLGVHTMENTESVTVSHETGSPEDVTTAAGTYATIPFKTTCNGIRRTWWLTRGIGIVKMEYDLFGETVTASLYETNMADFTGAAGKLAGTGRGRAPVRIQLDTAGGEAGRMREIMDVMRNMCPR